MTIWLALRFAGCLLQVEPASPDIELEDNRVENVAPIPAPVPAPVPPVPAFAPPAVVPPISTPEVPIARAAPMAIAVRGRILARGTRAPQDGAALFFGKQQIGETDRTGAFEIALPPGRQRVQVQQPGFQTEDVFVVVDATDRRELVIRLTPRQTGQSYETVIVAPEKQAERIALREEELTRTPGSLGDPLRVIESLPGVSQVVWPAALYTVRGANPGNTGFFLDGVRLPALFHLALGPSVIHPYFIESVDFYPGGYPARFGRYVSGVVSAQTRTPRADRVHASADLRLFDAGGIVVVPFNENRTTVSLAGRFSYTAYLLSKLSPDFTMGYWDYQSRIEHRIGPGRLTLFAYGSGDVLERKSTPTKPVDPISVRLKFHRVNLGWNGMVGGGRLQSALLYGRDQSQSFIPSVNNLPVAVSSHLALGRLNYSHGLGETTSIELGGDTEVQRLDPSKVDVLLGEQDILRDRTAIMSGLYAALTYEPSQRLLVSLGARGDLFVQEGTHKIEPSPRLNLRLRLADGIYLKGNAGMFAQMPSLPVSVPGFENFGLSSLGIQRSKAASVGVESDVGEHATAQLTGFIQRMDVTDLASIFNYDVQTSLLELRPARSYGAEVMLRRPVRHRLHGWLAYTLSKSERTLPPLNHRATSDFDQRHVLNLVGSYRIGGGYQFGSRFHYNTGRLYPVFDQGSQGNDRQAVTYQRLPAFYQVDVRFDRRWIFDKFILDLYLEFINTTLTRQVFDLKIRNDGSRDERSFRILLPSIGLHAEW
ncbi:MAG: TonB-dependent receptor [Deltaproteobacteria bacterium]|nr:TonB-dependent receptor [Deltaproteobacteria bacterium]